METNLIRIRIWIRNLPGLGISIRKKKFKNLLIREAALFNLKSLILSLYETSTMDTELQHCEKDTDFFSFLVGDILRANDEPSPQKVSKG